MTDEERVAVYRPMQTAGASPCDVYKKAIEDGVGRLAALYVLRSLYGMSFDECRALLIAVEGALPGELPPIRSPQELRKVLVDELAFCPCAPEESLDLLREFLQVAHERYRAVKGPPEEFGAISRRLEAHLGIDKSPGLAAWFVFGLERAELIQHGARLTDVWITTKGSWLLDGLNRFPGPLRGSGDEDP